MDLNTPFGPLRVVRLHPDRVPLPAYATTGAAGLDLTADLDAPVALSPLERKLIPTGLVLELPPHTEAQLRPRSGLALRHGVTLVNAPGTIDCDYRGEVQALLINLGQEPYRVEPGDRIAQLVIAPVTRLTIEEVPSIEALTGTARGAGGFGSTGKR